MRKQQWLQASIDSSTPLDQKLLFMHYRKPLVIILVNVRLAVYATLPHGSVTTIDDTQSDFGKIAQWYRLRK